jgi:hypothetical protein
MVTLQLTDQQKYTLRRLMKKYATQARLDLAKDLNAGDFPMIRGPAQHFGYPFVDFLRLSTPIGFRVCKSDPRKPGSGPIILTDEEVTALRSLLEFSSGSAYIDYREYDDGAQEWHDFEELAEVIGFELANYV